MVVRWPHLLQIVLGVVAVTAPLLELSHHLDTQGGGSESEGGYGQGAPPFLFTVCVLVATAWLAVTLLLGLEARAYVQRGSWILRFLKLFGVAALTVRLDFFLALYTGRAYDYLFFLFLVG